MTPDYYADLYRRYATFCKSFSGNWLYKICSGATITTTRGRRP